MYADFSDRARKVMALANLEAQRLHHEYIGTVHVLLGLVRGGTGVGAKVLENLGVDLRGVRLEVGKLVQSGPETITMGKLPQTPRTKKVIECAIEEARILNHEYVGTGHLLLGLLREQDGPAAQVLMSLGLRLEQVREEVFDLLGASAEAEGKEKEKVVEATPSVTTIWEFISLQFAFSNAFLDALLRLDGPEQEVIKTFVKSEGPLVRYMSDMFREILKNQARGRMLD